MPDYKHLLLQGTARNELYTSTPQGGGSFESPPRPQRKTHGERLLKELDNAERNAKERLKSEPTRQGLQFIPLEFSESADFSMELKRLESDSLGIRLINVRKKGDRNVYMVAVPDNQVAHFANRFRQYLSEDTSKGAPKNEPLASGISQITDGELASYWTDSDEQLPAKDERFWWEVWLNEDGTTDEGVEAWFRESANGLQIRLSDQIVQFPERIVILVYANFSDWEQFPGLMCYLEEFRRANLITGEFLSLTPSDQAEFINDLLDRTTFAAADAPAVCLLDTGVNRGHPLLKPAIDSNDVQAWNPAWVTADQKGHGTEMAGLALYGDLHSPLENSDPLVMVHRLESVKILPDDGQNDPPDYGPITVGSMAIAERNQRSRNRTYCMPVTAPSDRDKWQPSLWSASIDQACAGVFDNYRRLLILAAGNIREELGKNYPQENQLSSIEDPAQAWNAITVGACTAKIWPDDATVQSYVPIASPGLLSPASRTSISWSEREWPFKPDIVLEGGNYLKDSSGNVTTTDNLMVLTTQMSATSDALLVGSGDTSAATAQAAWIAAQLQADYPDYWPETIRGLLIHSAEWTPQMLKEFPYPQRHNRLRVYGWGVPDLDKAKRCAQGIATMVIQEQLQPYQMDGSQPKTRHMHLHELPMPRQVLEELGSTPVKMQVTLSYFVEPNPSRRGWAARYRYQSHGLRFDVRRPEETQSDMLIRLSRKFWPNENQRTGKRPQLGASDNRNWEFGPKMQTRGSIHSDTWSGTAAQLASSDSIIIYPVTGWWREQPKLGCIDKQARYSLIVTISTESTELPLYAAVENEIAIRSRVATEIETDIGDSSSP